MRFLPLSACVALLLASGGAFAEEPPFPVPTNLAALRAEYPSLNEGALAKLRANGFVVLGDEGDSDIRFAYPEGEHSSRAFVTTDALLETWCSIERKCAVEAETGGLAPKLANAVHRMAAVSAKQLSDPEVSRWPCVRRAAFVWAVADRLMSSDPVVPEALRSEVTATVGKIQAHTETWPLDYTQFTVRGYYDASAALRSYFLCSQWLALNLYDATGKESDALQTAVVLAWLLRQDPQARADLGAVLETRRQFAGVENSISGDMLIGALNAADGADWRLATALSPPALRRLADELAKPSYPSSPVRVHPHGEEGYPAKTISLLPHLATPDGIVFQQAVDDPTEKHDLPDPLAVAAALGSNAALKLTGKETLSLAQQSLAERAAHPLCLYDRWLGALAALASDGSKPYAFMQTEAWGAEKLNTQLASWARLRHNFILYVAPSYHSMGMRMDVPRALVEPYPRFFLTMQAMALKSGDVFRRAGGLSQQSEWELAEFASETGRLAHVAQAEIDGTATDDDYKTAEMFGSYLEGAPHVSNPTVADVASGGTGDVLHVATGLMYPLIVMPDPRSGVGYIGATSSYRQFVKGNSVRMTDSEWGDTVKAGGDMADTPKWTISFTAHAQGGRLSEVPGVIALFAGGRVDEGVAETDKLANACRDTAEASVVRLRVGEWLLEHGDNKNAFKVALPSLRDRGSIGRNCLKTLLMTAAVRSVRRPLRVMDRFRMAIGVNNDSAIRESISKLKALPLDSRAAYEAERRIAVGLASWGTTRRDCEDAIAALRTPIWQDCARYILLTYPFSYEKFLDEPNMAILVAFAKSATSKPLAAAALAKAETCGYLRNDPNQAFALLEPYLDPSIWNSAAHRELAVFETEGPYGAGSGPRVDFERSCRSLKQYMTSKALEAGDFELWARWKRIPPRESGLSLSTIRSLTPRDKAKLLILNYRPDNSRAKYLDVYQRALNLDPHGPLAPYALYYISEWSEDKQQSLEANSKLARLFPKTSPGLLARARILFNRLDLRRAKALVAAAAKSQMEDVNGYSDMFHEPVHPPVLDDIEAEMRLRNTMRAIVGDAEMKRAFPTPLSGGDRDSCTEILIKAFPQHRKAIIAELGMWMSDALDALDLIAQSPNDPMAGKLWQVALDTDSSDARDSIYLDRVLRLANLGANYRYSRDLAAAVNIALSGKATHEMVANARRATELAPGTFAEATALKMATSALFKDERPEDAHDLVLPVYAYAGKPPAAEVASHTSRRAAEEAAAKRRPQWTPLWTSLADQTKRPLLQEQFSIPNMAVVGGVLAAVRDQRVVAYSADDGHEAWALPLPSVKGVLPGKDGSVIAACSDGIVVKCDGATGRVLARWSASSGEGDPVGGYALTVIGDFLLIADRASGVRCIDIDSGKPLWERRLRVDLGQEIVVVAADNGKIFVTLADGTVEALALEDGRVVWATKLPNAHLDYQPIVMSRTRIAVPGQYTVVLNSDDGRKTANVERRLMSSPLGFLSGPDRTQREAWDNALATDHLDPRVLPRMSSEDDDSVAGTNGMRYDVKNCFLRAWDSDTQAILAEYPLGSFYANGIVIDSKRVYLRTYDDDIIAFPVIPPVSF